MPFLFASYGFLFVHAEFSFICSTLLVIARLGIFIYLLTNRYVINEYPKFEIISSSFNPEMAALSVQCPNVINFKLEPLPLIFMSGSNSKTCVT